MGNEVVLTVYFSANDDTTPMVNTLAGLLFRHTKAHTPTAATQPQLYLKLGFSYHPIEDARLDHLWGSTAKAQCREVKRLVLHYLRRGKRVTLNCYGYDQGGMHALYLAHLLGNLPESWLTLNLALLDPIPGFSPRLLQLDRLQTTLARQVFDLSHCRSLRHVLALYSETTLADPTEFAPLVPRYPAHCDVRQDVLPGYHPFNHIVYDGYGHAGRISFQQPGALLAYTQIVEFFTNQNTRWVNLPKYIRLHKPDKPTEHLAPATLDIERATYRALRDITKPSQRYCHSYQPTHIITQTQQPFVNQHHKRLDAKRDTQALSNHACALTIQPGIEPTPLPPSPDFGSRALRNTLKDLMLALDTAMTPKSRSHAKGSILTYYLTAIDEIESFSDKTTFINALRNVIALALQRDRHPCSFFTTTQSAKYLVDLLQQEPFRVLLPLIMTPGHASLRYRDLRLFVTGCNQPSLFHSSRRKAFYRAFGPEEGRYPTTKLTQHSLPYFLRRR